MDREVILLIGSNIEPEKNIPKALVLLRTRLVLLNISSYWETRPVGGNGQNYLNVSISARTDIPYDSLRFHVLREIETLLGRIRIEDKYAPRTMDIDVIVDNGQVMDEKLWDQAFIAVPVAQLCPDLVRPLDGQHLASLAYEFKKRSWIVEHPAPPL
jgi:2-amino-4-hydroxy-6-hydroxymethyldihydropteridine diphosphokinase